MTSSLALRRFGVLASLAAVLTLGVLAPRAAAQAVTSGSVSVLPRITVIAGGGAFSTANTPSTTPKVATSVFLNNPYATAWDAYGNLYIADTGNGLIEKITAGTNQIVVAAGGGSTAPSATPQAATSAQIEPSSVAVDGAGNLYIADWANNSIEEVTASTGQIAVVAGGGATIPTTTPEPAASALLLRPGSVAVDGSGDLYIADSNHSLIEEVTAGQIVVVAGGGSFTPSTTPRAATSASLNITTGVAVDGSGNIYLSDANHNLVEEVTAGQIVVVAGGGATTPSSTPEAATSALLSDPYGLAVDRAGNLYIVDAVHNLIEEVTAGQIRVVAGGGATKPSPTPEPNANAKLAQPFGVSVDSAGNLYIADFDNNLVEEAGTSAFVPATAVGTASGAQTLQVALAIATPISSIAAPGAQNGAQEFTLGTATGCVTDGVTINPSGTVCTIPLSFTPAYAGVRTSTLSILNGSTVVGTVGLYGTGLGPEAVQTPGGVMVFAGGGATTPSTTPEAALSASLGTPFGTAVDGAGNVYIADYDNFLIEKVSASNGQIVVVAGAGLSGSNPSTTPQAATSVLFNPTSVAVDGAGNLYIDDESAGFIEKVDASTGQLAVIAGGGATIPSATPEAATSAKLSGPAGVAVDGAGNLYIAISASNLIAEVNASNGQITAVAGGGATVPSATAEAATSASLSQPNGVAVDGAGNLYIADYNNHLVEEVPAGSGQIVAVAGGARRGSASTTPQAATSVRITPTGVAVDGAGDIYIADQGYPAIEEVPAATSQIVIIAGSGSSAPSTTAQAATSASLGSNAVTVDGAGNLYTADQRADLVEEVATTAVSVSFPATAVGVTSAPQNASIVNIGNQPLTLSALAITPSPSAFALQSGTTCSLSSPVEPGGFCLLSFAFTPTGVPASNATLTLADNSLNQANTTQDFTFTGSGAAPVVGLSPSPLSFTAQLVGTSTEQTVTLSNTGNTTLNITSVGVSGDFAETNNCGSSVAASANCAIQVTFTPTATGSRSGTLTITDNAPDSPETAVLSGTGIAPVASLSGSTLSFASQLVATPSLGQTLTLTNTGTAALAISSIATTGDFAQTNTCPASLAISANCAIVVTFTPTTTGSRSGSLTLTDSAAGSPQTVALSGTGIAPVASLSAASLTFPGQLPGTSSPPQTVTLTNTGTAGLAIASIAATGDFAQTNTCPASLAANGNCAIVVTFTPTTTGSRSGSLTLADNAAGSPQTVGLSGSGTVAVASLSASSLTFPSQMVGAASAPQAITLTNTGTAALAIANIAATGDFAQTNTCPASLAANSNCVIEVNFTPTAMGARTGAVAITDSASGSPQMVTASGTGTEAIAMLSAATVGFPDTFAGTAAAAQTVTLSNSGNVALAISAIAASGGFGETNNCGASVAASGSCAIQVQFSPTAAGSFSGALTISDNASPATQTVGLSGTGENVAIIPAAGTPASATVEPGGPASYSASLSPQGGFSGNIALSCAVQPASSTIGCAIAPTSLDLTGTAAQTITVSLTTTAPRPALIAPLRLGPGGWMVLGGFCGSLLLLLLAWLGPVTLRRRALLAGMAASVLLLPACGGVNNLETGATPAGTYTVTVTAAAAAGSRATQFTLIVQ